LPLIGLYKEKLIPYIQDPFAVGNLKANVPWSIAECTFGLAYMILVIVAVYIMRQAFAKGMILMLIVQLFMIQITILHFTPKIEAYSQRAAIEFYESKKNQDVYVHVLGFHSYAYLFYTQKKPSNNPHYYDEQWLLSGKVDKPTFFVVKIQDADQYKSNSYLKMLYEKNGFVFFERNTVQ
jgi:hypothetical protein